jgi:hypothetical protein
MHEEEDCGEESTGQEGPDDTSQRALAARGSIPENYTGSLLLGECFADIRCRHGHEVRLFNIGRDHFVACDSCRTYMHVGSNLMGNWRQEDETIWRANSDSVAGYELVE